MNLEKYVVIFCKYFGNFSEASMLWQNGNARNQNNLLGRCKTFWVNHMKLSRDKECFNTNHDVLFSGTHAAFSEGIHLLVIGLSMWSEKDYHFSNVYTKLHGPNFCWKKYQKTRHFYFAYISNKIAFQYDAYRPLVDRISQHALLRRGACSGRSGPLRCLLWGLPGPGGVVSQHALRQTPPLHGQNDRHV